MRFSYRLTIWECMVGGARRAMNYLVYKSGFFRTAMLILGGAALLGSTLAAVRDGGVHVIPVILTVCFLLVLCLLVWLSILPAEVLRIYRQCGKRERTVRIEDGSIFVQDGGAVREYDCRNIQEFQKQGCLYRITMTWRMGILVELYLPVRIVGGKEAQESFRRYVNDQRRISGDKLNGQTGEGHESCEAGEGCIRQKWNMDTVTAAMAESSWIAAHYMKRAGRGARVLKYIHLAVFLMLDCLIIVICLSRMGVLGAIFSLVPIGMILIRIARDWGPHRLSQQSIREALNREGINSYEETWILQFTPQGIHRTGPMLENTWAWGDVGYLFETDENLYFYSLEEELLFYMTKGLLGDWMAQKLFIQDCQAKGIYYQIVQPEYVRDPRPAEAKEARLEGHKVSGKDNFHVLDGGRTSQESGRLSNKGRKGKKKSDRNIPDTQEGWRQFWAEKEKEKKYPETVRVMVTLSAVVGIFLLAIFLPDFRGSQGIGGLPVIMDMPQNGEEYVFHPGAYENYKPLADQVTVLEGLGFAIPEYVVEEMNRSMEEMPMARAWIEGYPYASLLSAVGMPEWDYEAWEITQYSDQAYWFDWEGFNLDMEYVYILNGVNAMAGGDFAITDAQQDMSDVDWENGTGTVHLKFCINGEPYEYKLKMMNDWLDTDIIKDLNDALETAGVEKRVYAMEDDGQGCVLFCRDKAWAKKFKKETGIRLETR